MSISGQERMRISIHTSAREVTYSLKLIMRLLDISIHTSAREVTALIVSPSLQECDFNPHFRKGSDNEFRFDKYYDQISIHTSAREVTLAFVTFSSTALISIHTSAREVTPPPVNVTISPFISIHTSAREVTPPTTY